VGIVTGTFTLPNGSPAANALYQWKLSGDAIATSTSAAIVPTLFTGNLDTNGNMTATFLFNDALSTSAGLSTTYQLTVKAQTGAQIWNENYQLTGTAANINTIPPAGSTVSLNPVTVVTGPVFTTSGQGGFFGPGARICDAFGYNSGFNLLYGSAVTAAASTVFLVQFDLLAQYVVRRVTWWYSVGQPTTNVTGFAIYDATATNKLLDTGPLTNTSAAASIASATFAAVTLSAGVYNFCAAGNTALTGGGATAVSGFAMANTNSVVEPPVQVIANTNGSRFAWAANKWNGSIFPATLGALTKIQLETNVANILMPFFEP
jgi:hypothetical protein